MQETDKTDLNLYKKLKYTRGCRATQRRIYIQVLASNQLLLDEI